MTATYDPTLAADKDKVRFYIGDTDVANVIFSDEEIVAALAIYDTPLATAITMADAAASKYARKVSMSVDGLSVNYSDLARNFAAVAQRLRKQQVEAPGGLAAPYVAGVSIGDMDGVDGNTDRPASQFKIGQFDDPPQRGDACDS